MATQSLFRRVKSLVDRVVTPETREQFYENVSTFAQQQPILAAFLAIQILFSATPLLLFASFAIGTILLSLIVAVVFSIFWIGVALFVLVPTLFITVGLGVGVWTWAVTSFLIVRWIYNIVPVKGAGKIEVGLTNGKKGVVYKEENGGVKGEVKSGY